MRSLKIGVAIIVVCVSAAAAGASETHPTKLVLRVFQIPREQSFGVFIPAENGQTTAFQASGDVTANFPRATLLIPTELFTAAAESAIGEVIREKIVFGAGPIVARNVRVQEMKSLELEIGPQNPEAQARFVEKAGEGRTSDYEVRAEFVSTAKNGTIIRLRFDAGWSAQAGRLGVGLGGIVFDLPVLVPASKLLLIGARWQGTVYWLAVGSVPAAD